MNLKNCLLGAVCLALAALVAGCGGGGGSDGGGGISITNPQVTAPTTFFGGPVTVRAEIAAPAGVSSAKADITDDVTGVVKTATMAFDGMRYAGSVNVPQNTGTSPRAYTVLLTVVDTGGHSTSTTLTFQIPSPAVPPPAPF